MYSPLTGYPATSDPFAFVAPPPATLPPANAFLDPLSSGKLSPQVAARYESGRRLPVSIRNNNMGAISMGSARGWGSTQPGFLGITPRPAREGGYYAKYAAPEYGIAAADANLQRLAGKGLNTINKLVNVWAAEPGNYAQVLSKYVGAGPNDVLDMSDPNVRVKVLMGMSAHESGVGVPVYKPEVFYAAVQGVDPSAMPAPPAAPATGVGPILRKGARGEAVSNLQSDLAAKGFDPGPIDGIFGNKTRGAVRGFQASAGLKPDGVVGPLTYGQLNPPVAAVADEGPASPMGTVRIPVEPPAPVQAPTPSPDTIQGGAGTGTLAGGTTPPRVPEPYERMETAVGWLPQFPQPYDIPQQASPAANPAPATPPKPTQAPIPYNNDTLNRTLSGLPPTALQKIETVRQAAQQAGLPYIDIDLNSVIPQQQAQAPAPLATKPVQVASNDYQMPMGVSTASLGIGSPNSGLSIGAPAPGAAGPSATDLGIAAAGGYPPSSVIRPPPIAQPAPPLQQQAQAAPPSSSVIPQGGGIASAHPIQFGANRGTGGILGLLAGRGKNPASLIPTSSGSGPYGDDQVNSWVRGPTNALGGSEGLHWTGSNGRPVTAVENNWGSGYFTSYG